MSFGQLALWVSIHYWNRFDFPVIPQLVAMAVKLGLERGALRSVRVVAVNDFSTEIEGLSDETHEEWQQAGILETAVAILQTMRPKSANKPWLKYFSFTALAKAVQSSLSTAAAAANNAAAAQQSPSAAAAAALTPADLKQKLTAVLDALLAEQLIDKLPAQSVDNRHEERSLEVVYCTRHIVRPKRAGEGNEDMRSYVHTMTQGSGVPLSKSGSAAASSRPQSAAEGQRLQHNRKLQAESSESEKLQSLYLARHRDWLKPFMPAKEVARLEAIAVKHHLHNSGSGPGDDDSKPWLNPLYAVLDTPEHIVGGAMRPHQLEGLAWLSYMHKHGCPMILGDEMGLGKTLQTIAFLAHLKFECGLDGATLIVCPLSVLNSWMAEFKRWCPTLRAVRMHSSDAGERERLKRAILGDLDAFDAIITTYEMCSGDLRRVLGTQHIWRYVVLDEGHKVTYYCFYVLSDLYTLTVHYLKHVAATWCSSLDKCTTCIVSIRCQACSCYIL
jgi:SNF2-related domain